MRKLLTLCILFLFIGIGCGYVELYYIHKFCDTEGGMYLYKNFKHTKFKEKYDDKKNIISVPAVFDTFLQRFFSPSYNPY